MDGILPNGWVHNPANTIAVLCTSNNQLMSWKGLQRVMSRGWDSEEQKGLVQSWVQKLAEVNNYFFYRILNGMKSKRVQLEIISGAQMHYDCNSLDGLSQKQCQQQCVGEVIMSLLLPGKNIAPISLFSGLPRTAFMVDILEGYHGQCWHSHVACTDAAFLYNFGFARLWVQSLGADIPLKTTKQEMDQKMSYAFKDVPAFFKCSYSCTCWES